ncbi:glycosyltransferase [Aliirhizobium terrae]|uniref:glycosyltransferase n=1 Tax=Terrirhizobium terrae TaxID=2926709 RepID=UPI00257875A9|nr:glycosyltransferase [Rhizobium sp. CC-CFT758]WJH41857.1 glycosyltransferase [Rhizobium sp. CC-CFT758]
MLAEARKLILAGELDAARDLLRQIEAKNLGNADPATSLGLPRRLQSARLKLAKAEGDAISRIAYQFHLVPPSERLAHHAVFSAEERRTMVELSRTPVPHYIHQIWLGSRPVPPTVDAWAAHAAAHGYRHRLWREADLAQSGYDDHPALRHMLDEGDFPGAVDAARYMILRDLGGVYLDCDWFPARSDVSFHDFLPMTGLCAFAEETPRNTGRGSTLLANSFIATPPGNPVLARLCDALTSVVEDLGDVPAWWSTGPLIFTVVARSGPVTLADADFVAPAPPKGALLADLEKLAADNEAKGGGLLIPWKPW